jgi:parvulin-like peptidyl-prolyl isomerase
VAAIVDGHPIPMDEIVVKSVLLNREFVVDRKIEAFVVHREAKRRGLEASDAQIDARIAVYRKSIAPSTVAAQLKLHHTSMAEFREMFRVAIERDAITAAAIQPSYMVHCRQILLRCGQDGVPKSVSGAQYTSEEAKTLLADIVNKLSMGADFGALAAQYGDPGKTDLGVLYDRTVMDVDSSALEAALHLKKGEITPQPIKTQDGYCLIQAVSTGEDHPKTEDQLYATASQECRKVQMMFLQPEIVEHLINQSKISYTKDSEIVAGKPLPVNAAVINGHPIPMSEVERECVSNYGREAMNIAIENYVVDRECKRRGISVQPSEIDHQIEILRKAIAPKTIEQGMAMHHTTMAGLREDFRQLIEREKLVIDTISPPSMVHAQVIFVKSDGSGPNQGAQPADFAKNNAPIQRLADIRSQIDQGKSFDDLAKQYSEMGNKGDLGILYSGASNVDTAMLNTALKMKCGEITPAPIQTYGGYFLLRVVSTDKAHPTDENFAYAQALKHYKTQQADLIAPQAVIELVNKSKVVNYL